MNYATIMAEHISQVLRAAGIKHNAVKANPAAGGGWVIWPFGELVRDQTDLESFIERTSLLGDLDSPDVQSGTLEGPGPQIEYLACFPDGK